MLPLVTHTKRISSTITTKCCRLPQRPAANSDRIPIVLGDKRTMPIRALPFAPLGDMAGDVDAAEITPEMIEYMRQRSMRADSSITFRDPYPYTSTSVFDIPSNNENGFRHWTRGDSDVDRILQGYINVAVHEVIGYIMYSDDLPITLEALSGIFEEFLRRRVTMDWDEIRVTLENNGEIRFGVFGAQLHVDNGSTVRMHNPVFGSLQLPDHLIIE